MSEEMARLPWRLGEKIVSGQYADAVNELSEWIMTTVHDAPLHFAVETVLVLFVVALVVFRRTPKKTMGQLDLDPKVSRGEKREGRE